MNPIVSTGRHHNERPFTGRHQMSSRVLSRGFVRDTFNSPLALCLSRGDSRYLLFPSAPPYDREESLFFLPYPSRVSPWYRRLVAENTTKERERHTEERAQHLLSVSRIEREVKGGHGWRGLD